MRTTIGQLLVNEQLPPELQNHERTLTGDETDRVLAEIGKKQPQRYREISYKLMQLGSEAAYREGNTLSLADLARPDVDREGMLQHVQDQSHKIMATSGTHVEKQTALAALFNKVRQFLTDATYKQSLARENPFALQVASKARGNPAQLAALLTTPGVYMDADDNIVPIFVSRSYAEGLRPHEYWAGTYGARKSVVSTKFCLAEGTQVLWSDTCRARAIEQLAVGDTVYAQASDGRMTPTIVTAITRVGERLCWAYEFGIGNSPAARLVVATPEHGIHLERRSRKRGACTMEMAQLAHAKQGRRGAVLPTGYMYDAHAQVETRALLLGALLGDGGLTTQQTKLYLSDARLVRAIENCAVSHGLVLHIDEVKVGVTTYSLQELCKSAGIGGGHKTPFRTWLAACGVLGKYAAEKRLPASVYAWDRQAIGALVAGLWATDGCTTTARNQRGREYPVVTFFCTSAKLVEDFRQLLMWRLGVYGAPISTRRVAGTEHRFVDGRVCCRNHDLHGFSIADATSLRRLAEACPPVADKILRLRNALARPRYRRPNMQARYRREACVGIRVVYDIEVAHPAHRFVLANGLVVSNSTRDAGYLGKQFNQAAMRTIVTGADCETNLGIPVNVDDRDNVGAELAKAAGGFPAGTVLSKEVLGALEDRKVKRLLVRSPLTCQYDQGVCKHCVGLREDGKFPKIGDHVGINAASALAERIAQSSLNVKHSGGMAQGGSDEPVYAGFDVVEQLFQVPDAFPNRAAVASTDGRIDSIEKAPQGGWNLRINDVPHYVLPDVPLRVKAGDHVEAGDQLSGGIVDPSEVVRHKGLGEGRRYFVERATQAFRDSGYGVNRRNMELLARGMMNHAVVNDPDDAADQLPGDVVSYNGLAFGYRPRKDAVTRAPDQALGMYLEQPVLHYTIGTRITKGVAQQLGEFGQTKVTAHAQPPGFEPYMSSLRDVPKHEPDWVAQLGSSYLKTNLLKQVHRGGESHVHGLHPVPGIAKGTEFGQPPPGQVGY